MVKRFVNNPSKDWEEWGANDPYFAVVTQDQYRAGQLDEAALAQFFASGQTTIDQLLAEARAHLAPGFQPQSALDFGCGVGRLTLPLAALCQRVVGVDISDSMLAEARQNTAARGYTHVTFAKSDDTLTQVTETFDFIVSKIVFQHMIPAQGEQIFHRLIALLNPGGIGALHFVYHAERPWTGHLAYWVRTHIPFGQNIMNLVKGQGWGTPLMQMNAYDLNRLFGILDRAGCQNVHIQFVYDPPYRGIMLFFQK